MAFEERCISNFTSRFNIQLSVDVALLTFLLFLPGIGDRNSLEPPFGNAYTNSVAKKKGISL